MTPLLPSIIALIEDGAKQPDLENVREIDKRLRICKNPEKVVDSKAYLKKKAQEEAKATAKRAQKAEEVKALERDPFGGELMDGEGALQAAQIKQLDDDDD